MISVERSIFDLLKIGIGPSSSHTLGPMSMGLQFRRECISQSLNLSRIEVTLKGSLAHTGEGHLTPNAIVAGLCGFDPVHTPIDEIKGASSFATNFREICLGGTRIPYDENLILFDRQKRNYLHPNTAVFRAFKEQGELSLEKEYCSIGGGVFVEASQLESAKPV